MIRIKRSGEFLNTFRDYIIYVDKKQRGKVSSAGTIDIEVPGGSHAIYAEIDWCYSPTIAFDIKKGEVRTFKVSGFKYANRLIPAALFLIVSYYILKIAFNIEAFLLMVAAFPALLVLLYYYTLGRKNYLTLVEETAG